MNVRKFTANTSREALRLLREALGADAVILSNRNVDGKVEIMAMADEAIQSIAPAKDERQITSDHTEWRHRFSMKHGYSHRAAWPPRRWICCSSGFG
jgi:flagellar biosynthesis protein FlhF